MVTTNTLGAVTIIADTKVRNAKPRDAQYKLTDDRGLCLLVAPNGGKWWRLNYRFDGKQKTLSMGVYPEVTLADARARRDAARRLIAAGTDPSDHRKATKATQGQVTENRFEELPANGLRSSSPGGRQPTRPRSSGGSKWICFHGLAADRLRRSVLPRY